MLFETIFNGLAGRMVMNAHIRHSTAKSGSNDGENLSMSIVIFLCMKIQWTKFLKTLRTTTTLLPIKHSLSQFNIDSFAEKALVFSQKP